MGQGEVEGGGGGWDTLRFRLKTRDILGDKLLVHGPIPATRMHEKIHVTLRGRATKRKQKRGSKKVVVNEGGTTRDRWLRVGSGSSQ